jgi:hypothetical protein
MNHKKLISAIALARKTVSLANELDCWGQDELHKSIEDAAYDNYIIIDEDEFVRPSIADSELAKTIADQGVCTDDFTNRLLRISHSFWDS